MKVEDWVVFSTFLILFLGTFNGAMFDTSAEGDGLIYPDINYLRVNATIDNNYAVTEISEEFYNPYDYAVDETFWFTIPEKAFISNFSLTIDGVTHYAEVVSKEQAKKEYEQAVASGENAGLVESYGKSIFSFSVSLSPEETIVVGLRYEEFLVKTLGEYTYDLFIGSSNIESNVKVIDINVELNSELIITDITVPDYEDSTDITSKSNYESVVSFSTDDVPLKYDFTLIYELENVAVNGKMLNYIDEAGNGYFSHVFSPQVKDLGGSPMDKDIIFVLDKSGSMSGTKIGQLKDAFDEIVHELRSDDRFNIVMFNDRTNTYKNSLMTASQENQDAAATYINGINADGSTNINDALTTGLGMFYGSGETVPIIVFLTDGLPTAGETNTASIRNNIKSSNEGGTAIFSLGFGNDVDFSFLEALSLENFGHAIRIEEGADAGEQMTNFYDTISTPLLKDLEFTYNGIVTAVYPDHVDQLFEGSECVIVGRYDASMTSLTGNVYTTAKGGERIFSQTFSLDNNSEHSFIPRLWAYTRINELLDDIKVLGQDETLIGQIVTLATEYQFVTPYTSLLITIEESEEEEEEEEPPVQGEEPENIKEEEPQTTATGTGGLPSTHSAPDDWDGDGIPDDADMYPYDPDNKPRTYADSGGGYGPPLADKEDSESSGLRGGGDLGASSSVFGLLILFVVIFMVIIGVIVRAIVKEVKDDKK